MCFDLRGRQPIVFSNSFNSSVLLLKYFPDFENLKD